MRVADGASEIFSSLFAEGHTRVALGEHPAAWRHGPPRRDVGTSMTQWSDTPVSRALGVRYPMCRGPSVAGNRRRRSWLPSRTRADLGPTARAVSRPARFVRSSRTSASGHRRRLPSISGSRPGAAPAVTREEFDAALAHSCRSIASLASSRRASSARPSTRRQSGRGTHRAAYRRLVRLRRAAARARRRVPPARDRHDRHGTAWTKHRARGRRGAPDRRVGIRSGRHRARF